MPKIGGPHQSSGPAPTPEPERTSSSQSSSSSTQASESNQTDQAQSSQEHARSRMSEGQLGSSMRQSSLHSQVPNAPPQGGQTQTAQGASQSSAPSNWDIDGTGRMTPGPATPHTVDITQDPAFQALPEATRNSIQNDVSRNPASDARLQQIVNHDTYNQMTTEQRTQLLNVFANTGPQGRDGLATLMNRRVAVGSGDPPPTMPAILSGDNTRGQGTLLSHLNNMTTQPLAPEVANRRRELLARVIQETAEPTYRVDQGVTGTCAPTTVQMHMLQHSPAEYARIVSGLASPSRSVTLADGSTLNAAQNQAGNTITRGTPPQTINDPRSVSERMFQSAIQQYGDRIPQNQGGYGANYNFNANTDNTGLWDNQTARVMHGLYNRDYSYHPPGAGQGQGINNATQNAQQRTTMRNQLYNQVANEVRSGQGPVATHVVWGGTDAQGQAHGLHELLVERVENGRVYFRNPWGSREAQGVNYTDGQSLAGPPARRVEDSQSGLESMTEAQYRAILNGATIGPPVGGE